MEGLNLKICQNLVGKIFFLTFLGEKTSRGELKLYGGVILLLHFHYLIYLETANTQKSEVFRLIISSVNVNASVVTCSNLLKKCFRKTSLFVLTVAGVLEKSVLLDAYFKILCNSCDHIP